MGKIIANRASGGSKPSTPTIGAATDGGTGTTVSVAFTPSSYIGKGTIQYTATSSPENITATGSSSPITVTGLTTGTAYTFTVRGTTNYGVSSDSSVASNSVTPVTPDAFVSIASSNGSNSSSITFSSIPQTYKDLQIRFLSYTVSNSDYPSIRFNSDTGTNYVNHYFYTTGSSVTAFGTTSNSAIHTSQNITTNDPIIGIIDIHDYASTSKYKTARIYSGFDTNGGNGQRSHLISGLWLNSNAITSITIANLFQSSPFSSASSFALYGIKG